ncbi:MAG: hypothetical protein ACXU86_18670, partial [Archangium sp.]
PGADLFPVFGLAPFLVGVHEQPDWKGLRRAVHGAGPGSCGIGIPAGGGALLHPDGTLEPVRHPLLELRHEGGALREAWLSPPSEPYGGEVRLGPPAPGGGRLLH